MTNLIPERIISKEEERMIIENIENYINKLSDDEESSDEDSSSLGELIEESGENVEYVESSSDSEEESSSEEESDDSESSEEESCEEEDSDEEDNFNEYLNCSPYDTARYNTKLMEAVISNNTNQMMKELENCKYDSEYINEENDIGWTALFIACINSGQEKLVNGVNEGGSGWSNINVVKLLLDNGANPNHQDNDGDTILTICCRFSNEVDFGVFQMLIDYGANVNLENKEGICPLMVCRDINVAKCLIKNKANPNYISEKKENSFYMACKNGNLEMVKYLLTLPNINITQKTLYNKTALIISFIRMKYSICRIILNSGLLDFNKLSVFEKKIIYFLRLKNQNLMFRKRLQQMSNSLLDKTEENKKLLDEKLIENEKLNIINKQLTIQNEIMSKNIEDKKNLIDIQNYEIQKYLELSKNQLRIINNQKNDMNSQYMTIEGLRENLKMMDNTLQKQSSLHKTEMEKLKNENISLGFEFYNVEQNLRSEIDRLKNEININNEALYSAEQRNNSEIERLKTENQNVTNSLYTQYSDYVNDVNNLREYYFGIEDKCLKLQEQVQSLTEDKNNSERKINFYKNKLSLIDKRVNLSKERMTLLENLLEDKENDIRDLEETILEYKNHIDNVLNKEYELLEIELNKKEEELKNYKNIVKNNFEVIEDVKQEIKSNENQEIVINIEQNDEKIQDNNKTNENNSWWPSIFG